MTNDSNNVLENFGKKREAVGRMIDEAVAAGWIESERGQEMKTRMEEEKLTIGVIGQMKCGKSTFLNAFVFGDTVLPAATTPMTAALSVITYGEKPGLKAEFYTTDEWEEQKMQAGRNLEDVAGDAGEESKIQAARELVGKAGKLGARLETLLGTTQDDSLDNLEQYVGADGEYVSITKSVTIYYPRDYLKGVEIVDTPGFNDPIVSREERTREFLHRADVVVMMLYAGRPFDATDRDILFRQVRSCGIGRVLIGINKYDIPYCSEQNPEDEEQIRDYVRAELRKASSTKGDDTLAMLLQDTEPIPLSAEMALLSQLPMSRITENEKMTFAWQRHCENFGIGSQPEMRKFSHMDDLTEAIRSVVEKEKEQILFRKPVAAVMAAGDECLASVQRELEQQQETLRTLSMNDSELEEKVENVKRLRRRIEREIERFSGDISDGIGNFISEKKRDVEDCIDEAVKEMKDIVQSEKHRVFWKKVIEKLCEIAERLQTRTLIRKIEDVSRQGKKQLKDNVEEFVKEAESKYKKFLPDMDSEALVGDAKKTILFDIENNGLFEYTEAYRTSGGSKIKDFFTIGRMNSQKDEINDEIKKFKEKLRVEDLIDSAFGRKDEVIAIVSKKFVNELLDPVSDQLQKVVDDKCGRERMKSEAEKRVTELRQRMTQINGQVEKIKALKGSIE